MVPLTTLREWVASDDPLLHQLAFHTVLSHPETVSGLSEAERLEIGLGFLEKGMAGEYGDRITDGPYVLAHTMLGWLRQLAASDRPSDQAALQAALALLERLGRSGPAARDVVVLGVLEHALQDATTRGLFEGWTTDPDLAPLYEEAVRLTR